MTQDHYDYRTNPLFLRGQFDNTGKYGIPIIPKAVFTADDFEELRLIGFDKAKSDQGKHANRMVHFFLYDYKFERVWDKPEASAEYLHPYRAVLTPDFSMYLQMPDAMLLYNTFRNRWCGAYFASQGLRVIPTVNFGSESSFDFCFEGIERGSPVAVSTYMVQEKEGREAQKDFFMSGYREMLRRIEPETIICYHEPFAEMEGNVVFVDYELSSWRHMADDIVSALNNQGDKHFENSGGKKKGYAIIKYGGYVQSQYEERLPRSTTGDGYRVTKYGGYVVRLGSGSAYGGNWKPKKPSDERFFGKPGEMVTSYDNHGNLRHTKIGNDGKAEKERHYTDHGYPKYHSNPHDHIIKYKPDGSPDWEKSEQINYSNNEAPAFKNYKEAFIMQNDFYTYDNLLRMGALNPENVEDLKFHSISEFENVLRSFPEVVFVYDKKVYSLTSVNKRYALCEAYYDGDDCFFDSQEDILNYDIGGKKLRDIVTEIQVVERVFFG